MADPNTRQGKRTPVTLKIKFKSETLEQFIERYAVDVSQGGIFIRTKEPLAVGTQMRFEFQLRDASPLIGGEGTVVWTRENDPSRPAIAPGMGVRFDRLAEGSQNVLERILAEKAKQAPQRSPQETTKPPLFTDTPTRVAPAPVAEALLGPSGPARGGREPFNDQHTPLPKPMPFHSDADEYPDEAFEEATKVRALDELIAQTAESGQQPTNGLDELAARRGGRADSTLAEPPGAAAASAHPALSDLPETIDPASTSPGFASGKGLDRDSAPGLPSPPDVGKQPRLLDTTPSPRSAPDPMEKLAKTKLGMEPVPAARTGASSSPPSLRDAASRPSGMAAVPHESTSSTRMPAKRSAAPMVILLLLLVAAGGAAVWFFVLRDKAKDDSTTATNTNTPGSGSQQVTTPGSGSDVAVNSAGSGSQQTGSATEPPPPPAGPIVPTEITANAPKATIEVLGTDQKGPAPLSAKLEKDKPYKVRISAPGFATLETDLVGGKDKLAAKLDPKPRVIIVTSDPKGALILLDRAAIGHSTPFEVKLSNTQAAKRTVKLSLMKSGFRTVEKAIAQEAFEEEDTRMVAKLDLKLDVQVNRPPPPPPPDRGSGSATPPPDGGGSAPPPPDGGGSAPPPPPPPPTGGGSGSTPPPEPQPDFVKP